VSTLGTLRTDATMRRTTQLIIVVAILIIVAAGAWVAFNPAPTTKQPTALTISFANVPNLDPAIGSDEASSAAFVNLYDTLVYPTSTGDVKPNVATSWTVSPDGLTYTFKLRNDVKFHDGTTLTANDVVYSLNRLMAIAKGYSYLFTPYVSSVTAPDSTTVVINLKQPFGPFLLSLVRVYILNQALVQKNTATQGAYGANGDYGTAWLVTHDAGSGPYMVKDVKLEEYLLMEKNPSYWQQIRSDAPDTVKFLGTTEAATIRTLMSQGQLDITDRWQSTESLASLSNLKGVEVVSIPTSAEFYLMMNTKMPPTDDWAFRAAMTYAFDYQTVITSIFPGSPQAAGPVPSALPGHDPNAVKYTRDLTKARQFLAMSKYANQLDKVTVVYHWIAEVPDEEKVALLFANNMKEIGINVQVVKVPWLRVVDEMGNLSTAPNIVSIFDEASYAEAGSLLSSRYTSKSAGTWEQNEWLLNSTIDNMIADALSTIDRNARFQKYYQVQQVLMSMYPSIFVFDQNERRAYYSGYIDWYAAKGQNVPVLGYNFDCRFIGVDSAKKATLFPSGG